MWTWLQTCEGCLWLHDFYVKHYHIYRIILIYSFGSTYPFLKKNVVLFIFLVPIYFSLKSLLHSKKIWFTTFMLNMVPGIVHQLFSCFLTISVFDLQGETGKMSASDPNSAIYVTDSAKDIKNKVLVSFSYNRIFTEIFMWQNIVLCFWSFKMWKLGHISMLYSFIYFY